MARQNIDMGTNPNDGTGDTLRDGGEKINDNFIELYASVATAIQAYSSTVNLGAGVVTSKTTTVTSEPYSIMLLDSAGNLITDIVPTLSIVGGVYVLSMYSADALNNVKIKILY